MPEAHPKSADKSVAPANSREVLHILRLRITGSLYLPHCRQLTAACRMHFSLSTGDSSRGEVVLTDYGVALKLDVGSDDVV